MKEGSISNDPFFSSGFKLIKVFLCISLTITSPPVYRVGSVKARWHTNLICFWWKPLVLKGFFTARLRSIKLPWLKLKKSIVWIRSIWKNQLHFLLIDLAFCLKNLPMSDL